KIVDFLAGKDVAKISALLYLFLPLSLFFSRAVHIDFTALCFVHGTIYWFLVGYRRESYPYLLLATAMATVAMLVKVPYLFYFTLPVLFFICKEKKFKYFLKHSYLFLLPVGCFALWQSHVYHMNSLAPDWEFIPGYRKFNDNSDWYYGSVAQRLDAENWWLIWTRIRTEVLGGFGLVIGLIGLVVVLVKRKWIWLLWLLGTFIYVLVFFNLNRVHNYYQIPFVSIGAILMAYGILAIAKWFRNLKFIIPVLMVLIVAGESIYYAEEHYYIVQDEQIEIGRVIKAHTGEDDLVMINYVNMDSKCPNFLYRARRNGWQLMDYGLHASIPYQLMKEGGSWFATIRTSEIQGEMNQFLKVFPKVELPLKSSNKTLFLYDLDPHIMWDILPQIERDEFSKLEKG
ncbi:MAG: glycosyltransferase family 39 protein, partial [Flavobacteriales bacterium]|nr:glycosyltransferase family 39 protein [Flavobacteriales bacterium]